MARKFDIELNGIITLTYTDNNTGRRQQTKLKAVDRKSNSCENCFFATIFMLSFFLQWCKPGG